ncbi:hypothetical protein G6F57_020697 [Rhizopus arrhizus]|nr:hypothetical protein G6F57_020697 [Rhizopus arrhizus]
MLFYGFATWGNAGFMRESVCKYMCPYARFQSVMVDPDTFVVTYDKRRGDPRGGRSRKVDHKAAGLGDCVDCSLCVQVCPTGIDIRDGLQSWTRCRWPVRQKRAFASAAPARADLRHADPDHGGGVRGVAGDAQPLAGGCHPRPRRAGPGSGGRPDRERLPPADHQHV